MNTRIRLFDEMQEDSDRTARDSKRAAQADILKAQAMSKLLNFAASISEIIRLEPQGSVLSMAAERLVAGAVQGGEAEAQHLRNDAREASRKAQVADYTNTVTINLRPTLIELYKQRGCGSTDHE